MLIGYMRVSTDNDRQVLDLQRDALLGKRRLGGVLQQRRGGAYFFPLWGDGGTVGVLEYGGCLCHNVGS